MRWMFIGQDGNVIIKPICQTGLGIEFGGEADLGPGNLVPFVSIWNDLEIA